MIISKTQPLIIRPRTFIQRFWSPIREFFYDPFEDLHHELEILDPRKYCKIDRIEDNVKTPSNQKGSNWLDLFGDLKDTDENYQFITKIPEGFTKDDIKLEIKEKGNTKILHIQGEKRMKIK